jgi:hypothetical protein
MRPAQERVGVVSGRRSRGASREPLEMLSGPNLRKNYRSVLVMNERPRRRASRL